MQERYPFPSWASNFYHSPLIYEGITYADAESAFQSGKTTDRRLRKRFAADQMITPGKAKQMGRNLAIRPDWEEVKDDVMLDVLRAKFARGMLADMLTEWAGPLVEWTMWHDNYWGVCLCGREACHGGRNRLGTLLAQLRTELYGAAKIPGRQVALLALTVGGEPLDLHDDMAAGRGDEDWIKRFAGERA